MNTKNSYSRFSKWFHRPVDGATLGLFRMCWGVFMLYEALWRLPHAANVYSGEYFHFKYQLFTWVVELPASWMVAFEMLILAVAALGVLLGVLFRTSSVIFTLIYVHLFLIDEAYYNNYIYFALLISILLAFTGADKTFSVRSYRSRDNESVAIPRAVPFWNYFLLRAQIIIFYFYGGIAKLNVDWLSAQPLKHWFQNSVSIRYPMTWFAHQDWFAWAVAYGGIFINLGAPLLLLWRRTRTFAIVALIAYHLMNSRLFMDGLFPYLAIVGIIVFLEPSGGRYLWGRFQKFVIGASNVRSLECSSLSHLRSKVKKRRLVILWIVIYLSLQVAFPLRAYIFSDSSTWTEVGDKFSWTMRLRNKEAFVKFRFSHPEAEIWLNENSALSPRLTAAQVTAMSKHPWMMLQYARELDRILSENSMPDTKITVISVASLSARPYQVMIDPTADLTEIDYPFWGVADWILPLAANPLYESRPLTREGRMRAIMRALQTYADAHADSIFL
ncbi:MAG: HTTM domain-containing protein [Verrucomicrobiales bacterium]|nr:HTTM domain-containing protein [Verrucomicrobiales bacterium]